MDMQTLLFVSVIALWGVMLLNLGLTLTFVRWMSTMRAIRAELKQPELELGSAAPAFRATQLNGQSFTLKNYAGRSVVFLFVSPKCGHCRSNMPMFHKLAASAKQRANVDFVLVSDSSPTPTQTWLNTIHEEDGFTVTLPVLSADRRNFHLVYNPTGLSPYYCLLDEQQIVRARGPVGKGDWPALQKQWEAPVEPKRSIVDRRYA